MNKEKLSEEKPTCKIGFSETTEEEIQTEYVPSISSLIARINQAQEFLEMLQEKLNQILKEAKTIHEKDSYELGELQVKCFEELEQYFDQLKNLENYLKNLKETL